MSGLYKEFRDSGSISPNEPYRQLLAEVRDKLVNTRRYYDDLLTGEKPSPNSPIYRTEEELEKPLMLIYKSLVDSGVHSVAGNFYFVFSKIPDYIFKLSEITQLCF